MLTSDDLTVMRAAQVEAMLDTCVVLECLPGDDDGYGVHRDMWVTKYNSSCGYQPAGPREVMGTTQVAILPAQVRLPLTLTIDPAYRIQITHRLGEVLTVPETYAVQGAPQRGPSAQIVTLQSVPDTEVADG